MWRSKRSYALWNLGPNELKLIIQSFMLSTPLSAAHQKVMMHASSRLKIKPYDLNKWRVSKMFKFIQTESSNNCELVYEFLM